jgi:hypothetical protein
MGGKKKKGCSAILASPPSLAKPHEDKLSQLPRFPHVTHKQKGGWPKSSQGMLPLEPLLPIEVDNIRS